MPSRPAVVTVLAAAGVLLGLGVAQFLPQVQLALPWFAYVLIALGCALGLPALLGSMGSSGDYKAVARLWSLCAAMALVLVTLAAASAALSLRSGRVSSLSLLALALGLGLFAGLGLVKLALRQARQAKAAHRN